MEMLPPNAAMIYQSPPYPAPSPPTHHTTAGISRKAKHQARYKSHPSRQNLRPQDIRTARCLYRLRGWDGGRGTVATAGGRTRTARRNDGSLQNERLGCGTGHGVRKYFAVGLGYDLADDRGRKEEDEGE
jgi:hypothetical protein